MSDSAALDRYQGFVGTNLDGSHWFYHGTIPERMQQSEADFDRLWALHPEAYHKITIHGRTSPTPRWQQAYGRDYHYTHSTNTALPIPLEMDAWHAWVKEAIDPRLNGILLNWYDGSLGHYIGKHRDSMIDMIIGAPIVTISLGDQRIFRLRSWKGDAKMDFEAKNGTVFILPFDTNQAWTHEVPKTGNNRGRRISLTFRAFE